MIQREGEPPLADQEHRQLFADIQWYMDDAMLSNPNIRIDPLEASKPEQRIAARHFIHGFYGPMRHSLDIHPDEPAVFTPQQMWQGFLSSLDTLRGSSPDPREDDPRQYLLGCAGAASREISRLQAMARWLSIIIGEPDKILADTNREIGVFAAVRDLVLETDWIYFGE